MDIYHEILEKYWGYKTFKELQLDIIQSVTNNNNTLGILPTGAGKSICYQIPTIATQSKAIIISPLIALMKDQVLSLAKRNIKSSAVFRGMSKHDIANTLNKFSTNDTPFLFMSPERLQTKDIDYFLEDTDIKFLVVDEAHCISQWGYDFRPNYLLIGEKKELIPQATTLALTASATPTVQKDILEKLKLNDCKIFKSAFERKNIAIQIYNSENKVSYLCDYLNQRRQSSIVYCNARFRTHEIADVLNSQNIPTAVYNAGMNENNRSIAQTKWMDDTTPTIVCTNAFGMGIDKPNVRTVIHNDTPDSPEAYYQEIGRAGRDGEESNAILLYYKSDLGKIDNKVNTKYPLPEKIKHIYNLVMQFCNIAYEEGEDEIHPFDIDSFCEQHKLQRNETYNCLKILEQNNFWKLSEGVFLPAKVWVTAQLYEINFLEHTHKPLFEILQGILRLYGGVLNSHVKINVLKMAEFLKTNTQYITDGLHTLHNMNLIDFVEAIDKPFIYFHQNRVRDYEWKIDTTLYNTLKQLYKERLLFMENFITNTKDCLMKTITLYFDAESQTKNCEKCSNCINKKMQRLSSTKFKNISIALFSQVVMHNKIYIAELYKRMHNYSQTEIQTSLDFLLKEKYIVLNPNGELQLTHE